MHPFNEQLIREFLIQRRGHPISYGDVASAFGHEWSLKIRGRLIVTLDRIGEENRRNGEPLLCALVVSKKAGVPEAGFFEKFHPEARTQSARRAVYERILGQLRHARL